MIKKLAIVAMIGAAATACGDEKKKKTTAGGGGGVTIGAACTTAGSTNCSGDILAVCQGGSWAQSQDCATNSQTCGETEGLNGVYSCQFEAGACTVSGFSVGTVQANGDPDVTITSPLSILTGEAGGMSDTAIVVDDPNGNLLLLENWVGFDGDAFTAPGTISMAGLNASYDTCGLCIFGLNATDNSLYIATSGTVEATQWSNEHGGAFSVTLTDIEMANTQDDGRMFCIPSLTISGTVQGVGCGEVGTDPDNRAMTAGEGFCANNADNTISEVWSCVDDGGFLRLDKTDDCDDQTQVCQSNYDGTGVPPATITLSCQ